MTRLAWRVIGVLVVAGALLAPSTARADEGKWMVRLRALSMHVQNNNSTTAVDPAVGTVHVDDKVFPEFDFSYFVTPHFGMELVLTYPQEHDVKFAGTKIGSLKHLPPTFLLQYHFIPEGAVRPYLGLGINYTLFMNVDLDAAPAVGTYAPIDMDNGSLGLALQAGLDLKLAKAFFLNVDAKWVQIEAKDIRITGGELAGTKVTDLKVDPWLLSVGLGWRF